MLSPVSLLPPITTNDPSQVYSRRTRSSTSPPVSSPDSGILPTPLASNIAPEIVPPRYPPRVRRPPVRYFLADRSNHPIFKFVSYQGLFASYQSYLSQVDSVSIPRSVHEAL